jgi:hypothetical protein
MSKRLEDFEFEATCKALEDVAGDTPANYRDAIEIAAYALHFLYVTDQFEAFRDYLREVKEPATHTASVEREFTGMEEAMAWLRGQPPPSLEMRVRVARRVYSVWRDGDTLRLLPIPTPQELEE